jgi:hypothetical protein
MNCPSCSGLMTSMTLEGHVGTTVAIDACESCALFWFDRYESLQLAPGSTLKLFRLIGERTATTQAAIATFLHCPRCTLRLIPTHDRQRSTPFEYWRCDREDGRLITFFNFLREKDFIRPLSPSQIEELRQNIDIVKCSNCGAPVDLVRTSACAHCGSPLSMLDMKQAEHLIEQLKHAAVPKPIDPDLPLKLQQARREVEQAFSAPGHDWMHRASTAGLVEAGLGVVLGWLKDES